MGCPKARAGAKILKKKGTNRTTKRNQILTSSLITTSGVAVGVALVIPTLVGGGERGTTACSCSAEGHLPRRQRVAEVLRGDRGVQQGGRAGGHE